MSQSRVCRGREPCPEQKEFFRKLLSVLGELVDDDSNYQMTNGSETKQTVQAARNIAAFKELCEDHGQLTDHTRSLLKTLGGGGHTASALKRMHEAVEGIRDVFYFSNKQTDRLNRHELHEAVASFTKAASESMKGFKDLGIFNRNFFDTLERLVNKLQDFSAHVESECGSHAECRVDSHLDSMLQPSIQEFDSFLSRLTHIAEKEITAIRQAQNFLSQRYLDMTTIATFLSSVTATTLQISRGDTGIRSPVVIATNTLWLISLVLSIASAVYSLLVMTWRQASLRQPEVVLPSILLFWFGKAPMSTLIAALTTFSAGLCLLAFRIAGQEDMLGSSIAPIVFAGTNACAVALLSSMLLRELWKRKQLDWNKFRNTIMKTWENVKGYYHKNSSDDTVASTDQHANPVKRLLLRAYEHISILTGRSPVPRNQSGNRTMTIEDGDPSRTGPKKSETASELSIPNTTRFNPRGTLSSPADNSSAEPSHSPEQPSGGHDAPETSLSVRRDSGTGDSGKQPKSLVQFSTGGSLLAAAWNNVVSLYVVGGHFPERGKIRTPTGERIIEIAWREHTPRSQNIWPHPEMPDRDLLVRCSTEVTIWTIQKPVPDCPVGHMKETVGFAQWSALEDSETPGFICAAGTKVKFLNNKCEELWSLNTMDIVQDNECKELWSPDIKGLRSGHRTVHAALFRKDYLLCLVDVPDQKEISILLVIHRRDRTILSSEHLYQGHVFMTVSAAADRILFQGSENGAEIVEFSSMQSQTSELFVNLQSNGHRPTIKRTYSLRNRTLRDQELSIPEEAVTFYGHQDEMIIGYSKGKVMVLDRRENDSALSARHTFLPKDDSAMPQEAMGFAVNRGRTSKPYMFAFCDEGGSITVWSVLSNTILSDHELSEEFVINIEKHLERSKPSTGRLLKLRPSIASQSLQESQG